MFTTAAIRHIVRTLWLVLYMRVEAVLNPSHIQLTAHVEDYCLRSLLCTFFSFFVFFCRILGYSKQSKSWSSIDYTGFLFVSRFYYCKLTWEDAHLSLTKLELAKQSNPELIRRIEMPGVLMAMGYWLMSQKWSVPGSLPSPPTLGLMEFSIILANEIVTCTQIQKLTPDIIRDDPTSSCS